MKAVVIFGEASKKRGGRETSPPSQSVRGVTRDTRPVADMASGSRNGTLWNVWAELLALLRLDVGSPDHLAPLLGFVGDQLAELGRRPREHYAPQVGKSRL